MQPGDRIKHRKSRRATWTVCAVNHDGTIEARRWMRDRRKWRFKRLTRPEEYRLVEAH